MGRKNRQGGKGRGPGTVQPHERPDVPIERVDDSRWRIPKHGKMRVDGRVYASDFLMESLRGDPALDQVRNVAHLPGIIDASMAMPDIHWGYGFPIGGVAAFGMEDGVVSPGGVGYDINCGVRILRTDLPVDDVRPRLEGLVAALYRNIPQGVGSRRSDLRLSKKEMRRVAEKGARWAVENGYGDRDDLAHIEENGTIPGANFEAISDRAVERGSSQVGTLGSGNHFCEVQVVHEIHDRALADALGLVEGHVVASIHTGSRGFGYQVCADFIRTMEAAARKYGIELPDRQLCCAPLDSEEGRRYMGAMAGAANFAFANRQLISHWVQESFRDVFGQSADALGLRVVYDVAHNIAKFEEHTVGGEKKRVCVHRKGATRALPAGHPEVPEAYREVGQPVFIPGDMGRRSFVLVGAPGSLEETFGSCCHGAGRVLSRKAALRATRGRSLIQELREKGIVVMAAGKRTVGEEAPEAYKDVRHVVDTVQAAGIAKKVAELRPIGVIKG